MEYPENGRLSGESSPEMETLTKKTDSLATQNAVVFDSRTGDTVRYSADLGERYRQAKDLNDLEMQMATRRKMNMSALTAFRKSPAENKRTVLAGELADRLVLNSDFSSSDERDEKRSRAFAAYLKSEELSAQMEQYLANEEKMSEAQQLEWLSSWMSIPENASAASRNSHELGLVENMWRSAKNGVKSVGTQMVSIPWLVGREYFTSEGQTRSKSAYYQHASKIVEALERNQGFKFNDEVDFTGEGYLTGLSERQSKILDIAEKLSQGGEEAEKLEKILPVPEGLKKKLSAISKETDDRVAEVDEKFSKLYHSDILSPVPTEKYTGDGAWWKNFVSDSAGAAANLATQAAMSRLFVLAKLPFLARYNMHARIGAGTYIRGVENGADSKRALTAGFWNAAIQAPLENFSLGKMLSGAGDRKSVV